MSNTTIWNSRALFSMTASSDITCKFCNMSAPYTPLAEVDSRGMRVYYCHPCKAEYICWGDGAISSTHLYTIVNGNMYRWTVGTITSNKIYLWYVGQPGIPGIRPNKEMKLLKAFEPDSYPHMNPINISTKIRNLLAFL